MAEDGRVVIRPVMNMGVTFDHRFMDGYQGGAMAQLFRAYLEDPARFEAPQARRAGARRRYAQPTKLSCRPAPAPSRR